MVNPCCLGGFWHVQTLKCWPFGWIGHIPFRSFWIGVDLLGGIDTDSLGFLPDMDLLGVERPHFYNHFGYVDLLGGMEKELSDSFSDLDLLGGHPSVRFIQASHRKNLAFWPDSIRKTRIHGWISNQNVDLLGGKCWPFGWEVLTFWVGSVDFLGGKCWPFGWEVLTFWVVFRL